MQVSIFRRTLAEDLQKIHSGAGGFCASRRSRGRGDSIDESSSLQGLLLPEGMRIVRPVSKPRRWKTALAGHWGGALRRAGGGVLEGKGRRGTGQQQEKAGTMAQTMRKTVDGKTKWASARERLRREVGDPVFDAWIGAL